MTNTLPLNQAVSRALADHARPVLTGYRLGLLVYRLVLAGEMDGQRLNVRAPDRRRYAQALRFLHEFGLVASVSGVTRDAAFTLAGRGAASPAEIACTVDPFAYVSHLSAMELHGFTDRVSQTLFLATPEPKAWKGFAAEMMRKDLGEQLAAYGEAGFPLLQRTRIDRLQGRPVRITHRSHLGAFRKTADSEVRVATIGRTFLDMLREPQLCGGIHHVLAVYQQHAARNLALIAAEVDQHGGPIDRVRAGYVLEELCGLQHPSIDEWQKSVARGGSRRLVAANEYAPTYSERWALSLNAD